MRSNSRCFGAWSNNTSKIWPGHSQRNYLILRFGHVFTPNHLERWWVVPILYNIVYTMRPGVTLDHIDIHVHTQHLHGHPSQLMGIYCFRHTQFCGATNWPNLFESQGMAWSRSKNHKNRKNRKNHKNHKNHKAGCLAGAFWGSKTPARHQKCRSFLRLEEIKQLGNRLVATLVVKLC